MKLLSFIIPIKNEEGSIDQLTSEIVKECKSLNKNYEIIFVDDGSTDRSFQKISKLRSKNKKVRVLKHRRNFGKSKALTTGFSETKGDIVFTLDGDLQDNPKEIKKFLKKIDQGYDLVSGWKKVRHDPLFITLPSKIGNFVIGHITGLKTHDLNCGFKAYKKEVVDNLHIYGELYRFIPILANQKGYKVAEVPIKHRPRKYGKSKYGFFKIIKVFIDLITVLFLTGYSNQPGHFFGTLGISFFVPGFLIGLYITFLRITTGGVDNRYPLLFLGILLMVVGVQFVSTGLLAEMIINLKKNED